MPGSLWAKEVGRAWPCGACSSWHFQVCRVCPQAFDLHSNDARRTGQELSFSFYRGQSRASRRVTQQDHLTSCFGFTLWIWILYRKPIVSEESINVQVESPIWYWVLPQSAWATTSKYRRMGGFNNRNLFLTADLVPGESSLPGLPSTIFSLGPVGVCDLRNFSVSFFFL